MNKLTLILIYIALVVLLNIAYLFIYPLAGFAVWNMVLMMAISGVIEIAGLFFILNACKDK